MGVGAHGVRPKERFSVIRQAVNAREVEEAWVYFLLGLLLEILRSRFGFGGYNNVL